jgi:MoaA/NifB/PqqE/SkfB family radical SAM enzyme
MQLVKSFGMFGYICTNGTLFGHEMIKHLVEIGWDRVKVSLHGASAATHDRLVGVNGSFEKVVSALKLFTFWKKRLGRDKPLLEIGVVLVKNNFKEIVKMVELAHKLEIQAFFLEPLTVYTEVGKRLRLSEEELEEFRKIVTEARRLVKKFNLESNLIGFEADVVGKTGKMEEVIRGDLETLDNDFLSAPCFEPWYRMGIRVDGIVCPCGFFDAESKENVKEKSLKEIWFGEYFDLRRRQILQKKLSPHCSKCCVTLVSTNKLIRDELKKFSLLLSKG